MKRVAVEDLQIGDVIVGYGSSAPSLAGMRQAVFLERKVTGVRRLISVSQKRASGEWETLSRGPMSKTSFVWVE